MESLQHVQTSGLHLQVSRRQPPLRCRPRPLPAASSQPEPPPRDRGVLSPHGAAPRPSPWFREAREAEPHPTAALQGPGAAALGRRGLSSHG